MNRCLFILVVSACLSLAALAVNPAAAENVTINGQHNGHAYGNSTNGGVSDNADPNNNSLTITNGGKVSQDASGGYRGVGVMPYLTHPANNNSVTVEGDGEVDWRVYGGYYYGVILFEGPGYIEANNNSVTISDNAKINGHSSYGSPMDAIFGGYAAGVTATVLLPGNNMTAEASNNSVTINGGTIGGNVYGGWARPETPSLSSATAKALNNSVTINGGVINGNIYGGWADTSGGWSGATATATGNSVTINGNPTISGDIYGGYGYTDAFTGNTLNKNSVVNLDGAYNFEFVNFGYSGAANIDVLDTTPGGSAQPGVVLNTNANDINFNGVILGAGALIKQGAGILTLVQANTYSGGTTINQGLINFANLGNLGTGNITLDGGGLQWAAGNTADISARPTSLGTGGGIFDTNGNNVTLAGSISGPGGLTKTGAGILTLSGVNSYQGITTVSVGRLVGSASSLPGDIRNNTELEFRQAGDGDYFGTISGGGSLFKSGNGALNMMMNNITQDAVTVSAGSLNVVFGSAMRITNDVRVDAGTLGIVFGGNIRAGGDVLVDAGFLEVLIDSGLDVAGGVRVGGGELNVEFDSRLDVVGDVRIDSGSMDVDMGSSMTVGGDVRVASGILDVGFDNTVTVSGDVGVDTGALGVDFGSLVSVSGDLGMGVGAILGVHVDDTPAVNANTVTAQPGAILNVEGYSEDGRYTVVHSGNGINGDFILYVAGAPPASGLDKFLIASLFNDGRDLAIDQSLVWLQKSEAHGNFNIASGEFTMAAALADNTIPGAGDKFAWDGASLTKTGPGTLILRGHNTYTGATTVRAGTLEVMGSLGGGNYAGAIINDGAIVFNQSADQILSGVISGQGGVEKLGGNTLVVNGPSFSAGSLIMREGATLISSAASLGDTTVASEPYTRIGSGAILGLSAVSSINKGSMGNSFTLQRATTLLVEPGGEAIQVNAQTVELASDSQVSLQGFGYGPVLTPGSHTVLTLGGQVSNSSTLPVTSGTVAVGAYHYAYDNLAWSADGTVLSMNVRRDSLLTGDAAITGSSHIVAFNPAFSVFGNHARGLFNHRENPEEYATGPLRYTQAAAGEQSNTAPYLNRLWITPNYVNVNQSSSGGNVGYLLQTPGFAFGYDRQLNEHAFIGAGVSVSWPDYAGGGTDIDARDITMALYAGTRLPYGLELDGHAGWGFTRYDQDRAVANEHYSDKYNGQNLFVGLGLGRSFALGEGSGFALRPGVAYDYIHARLNGFDEGAGTFAVKSDDYSLDLHRLKAGVDISWLDADSGFKAQGEVYYLGVYGDREASAVAHYVSNPSSDFAMLGNGLDKDNLGLGINLALPVTEQWEVGASYNVLLGADTVSQQGTLNVIFKF